MTPGAGTFASVAIAGRIPYIGLCFNEEHRLAVQQRLEIATLAAMITEGNAIYDSKCAEAFTAPSGGAPPPGGRGRGKGSGGRGRGRGKATPKGKAAGKAKAAAAKARAGEGGNGDGPGGLSEISENSGEQSDWTDDAAGEPEGGA